MPLELFKIFFLLSVFVAVVFLLSVVFEEFLLKSRIQKRLLLVICVVFAQNLLYRVMPEKIAIQKRVWYIKGLDIWIDQRKIQNWNIATVRGLCQEVSLALFSRAILCVGFLALFQMWCPIVGSYDFCFVFFISLNGLNDICELKLFETFVKLFINIWEITEIFWIRLWNSVIVRKIFSSNFRIKKQILHLCQTDSQNG